MRKTKHDIFFLYDGEKQTSIFTKVSHGPSEDIGDTLLKRIRDQLQLDKNEVDRFLGCPMGYEEYIQTLRRKNIEF